MARGIVLIAIGKAGSGAEAALTQRYAERLSPPMTVVELPDGRGSASEIKRREAAALLDAIPQGSFIVALDQAGEMPDTPGLAARLARWRESGRNLAFLIGGAEGLDRSVLDRADAVLSLGTLTWPHLLARAMLAEALYRADSLARGHPYHRSGRP